MSLHPNAPPVSKPKRGFAIAGIVVGSLLTLAPVFGAIGTVIGMMGAFSTLGDKGVADPEALSKQIALTLNSTALGLFVFPIGIVVLAVSIILYTRRKPLAPPPMP